MSPSFKSYFILALFLVVGAHAEGNPDLVKKPLKFEKIEDYQTCQARNSEGHDCQEALNRWVGEHPADAFTAAKMTRQHMNAYGAIPLFHQAFAAKSGTCSDHDLLLALKSAFDLSAQSNQEIVTKAKSIAFDNCFSELKEELEALVHEGGNSRKNVCPGLTSKHALSGEEAKLCKG